MEYRIGIDLGTNSLGWAAVRLKEEGKSLRPGSLLDMGVRIFSNARNPKLKESNAAQRRGPRGMRRNRDRRLMRRDAMLRELRAASLFPEHSAGRKTLKTLWSLDPWILRYRALQERLTPHEVGRALFHLQQRRGFKSNRKTDGDAEGAMFDAIKAVRARLDLEDARTLGELLGRPRAEQQARNDDPSQPSEPLPQARVKATITGSKMAYDYYPDRSMILDEFEAIWAAQATHHPDLMTQAARDRIRYVIEHQRPLKPQRAGKCTFLPEEPRAPKAIPSAQYARILQEVNHLRVGAPDEGKRPLSTEERACIVDFLMRPSNKGAKRTFKAIRKRLNLPESQTFSHESNKRDHLVGDLTAARLMQENTYGPDWLDLSRADIIGNVQDEGDIGKSSIVHGQDALVARLLASEQFEDFGPWAMEEFGLDETRARAVFGARLPDAHGKLSLLALEQLIPWLEAGHRFDEATEKAFGKYASMGDGVIHEKSLPYYGKVLSRHTAFERDDPENEEEQHGRVANPTVHVALNELRKVINDLIRCYGPPRQVVLELARNLPLSGRGLRELEKRQKDNQDANDKRRADLETLKQKDTYKNRLKLRLYEEALDAFGGTAVCVFSGDTISMTAVFDGTVEVEHLLPLSRTLDDSFSNKVLASQRANRIKKNQSPFEAFGSSPDGFDWKKIGQRAAELPSGKQWRFDPDAMDRWADRGGFLDRQLNDTRYIARLGKTFVEALYGGQGMAGQDRNVWAVPGQLTSDLRHHAGFNTLLPGGNRKERSDHRHHAVDALVVALTDHAMIKRAADLEKREDRVAHWEILAEMAKPLKRYRKEAEDRLSKLVVSHKPDHGFQAAMHNDTAYGLAGRRDGRQVVVTRKPLDALTPKHLDRIADTRLAEGFKSATGGLSGKAFRDALVAAGESMSPPVRRVRLHEPMSDGSLVVIRHGEDGKHVKAYKGDGNYCYDIFMGDKGKWAGEVITTFDAYQIAKGDPDWWRKPVGLEGQPLIMRLRKGDMLELKKDNGDRSAHIVTGFTFVNRCITLFEHHESNAGGRARPSYKGEAPLKATFKVPSTLQKAEAVKITVSPSGKVRRHKA